MADENKTAKPTEVKQPPVEVKPPQEPVAPVAPAKEEQPAPVTPVEGGLSEGISDRTREQFDKLKDSNKRLLEANRVLQEEISRRSKSEQTFAPIQQGVPQTEQPQPAEIEKFIETDPLTGEQYVNEAKLRGAITEANARAVRAESAIKGYISQQQAAEEERQTREAFTAHPELNPGSETFDKELHRRTRAILLDSMMNPVDYGDHILTFKEAGDLAKSQTVKEAKVLEQKVEQERQESMETKEQASLAAQGKSGTPPPQQPSDEYVDLVKRTRGGDLWALAKRLQNVPHVKPAEEGESKE